jgi:hypothetical protein
MGVRVLLVARRMDEVKRAVLTWEHEHEQAIFVTLSDEMGR